MWYGSMFIIEHKYNHRRLIKIFNTNNFKHKITQITVRPYYNACLLFRQLYYFYCYVLSVIRLFNSKSQLRKMSLLTS